MTLHALAATDGRATAQQDHTRVVIPRGPASRGRRFGATLVDTALAAIPLLVGAIIIGSLADANGGGEADRVVFGTFALAAAIVVHVWNIGYRQGRSGASVGKSWLGLVARDTHGDPLGTLPSLNPTTRREVVRARTATDEGFRPLGAQLTPATLHRRRVAGINALVALLVVVVLASIAVGARPLDFGEIWHALTLSPGAAPTDTDVIVRDLRLHRTVLALITGASLGLAGALIQGHTRNPLADPGILGVSAGAACAVVLSITFLGVTTSAGYVWPAMGGALLTSILVFGLSTMGSRTPSPLSLVLGGAAVSAFLSSITSAVVLLDQTTLNSFRFWVVGSVAGRGPEVLAPLLPFFAVGIVLALVSAPGLNLLSLGTDVARSLGTNLPANRVMGILSITVLTAAATAACGPIGFVGLVVPHVARAFAGPDYRWLLPYSALVGAILLTLCDVLGRVVARPAELQVGIVLALIGAPFFIALVRRKKLATL